MADKNSIKKLVPSSLHGNILVDDTHEKEELKEAYRRGRSKAFDPESTGYVKYENKIHENLLIVPFFDSHVGGQGTDTSRLQMAVNYVSQVNNAVSFCGGDTIDNANTVSATNPHTSKLNPDYSLDLAVDIFQPIADKLLFVLGGNHDSADGARNKISNADFAKQFAKRLMQKVKEAFNEYRSVKYFKYNAVAELPLAVTLNKKKIFVPVGIFGTHGSGSARSKAGVLDVALRNGWNGYNNTNLQDIIIHIMFSGHFHAGVSGIMPVSVNVYDEKGNVINKRDHMIWVQSCSAMQGPNSFTESNNMQSSVPNVHAYDVNFKATLDSNKKPIFVLEVNQFPILKTNSNDLTDFAKKYLELHKSKVNEQAIREATKDKTVEQLLQMI